jgi:methyl-accepting chemotaxis protein
LGWVLLGGAGETVDASLELTGETIETGAGTVSLISDALRSVQAGLVAVTSAITEFDVVLEQVGSLSEQASRIVGEDIPDGLDETRSSLPGLAKSLDDIAAALNALSFIGVNVDIDPAAPVRAIDERLTELADQLRADAVRLGLIGSGFDSLSTDITTVEASLSELSAGIDEAEALVDEYRDAAKQGGELVVDARLDLDNQINAARLVVLLIGLSIAMAQIAPGAVGLYLLRTEDSADGVGVCASEPQTPAEEITKGV